MIEIKFRITEKQFECSHIHKVREQECNKCGIPTAFFNTLYDLKEQNKRSGIIRFDEPKKGENHGADA